MADGNQNPYRLLGLVTSIGLNWAVSILVGVYGGRWLDGHFRTQPLFTIVGIILGMIAGAIGSFRTVARYW